MCEYRSSKEKWKMADSRVLEMYAGNLLEEMQEIEKMIPEDQENEIESSHRRVQCIFDNLLLLKYKKIFMSRVW